MGAGDAQLNFSGDFGVTFEGPVRIGPDVADPVEPFALEGIALFLPLLNGDVTAVRVSDEGTLTLRGRPSRRDRSPAAPDRR